ncbi:ABC transporter permease [Bacillus cereus]|jgi:ABC-type antimicrobial peptide transport system permease subunit|uniref:ABC transporter permease n=1 Tax=Bacillus thuringiensis subsp. higo TaxID=132266 RepID=A0A9X6LX00_BACUH|nr:MULTISPECIES: FtsX-like permease family protein [Bacillus]AKR10560.1 ABC transporter permease [Bacillus thuringiensis]KIQ81599.1 ABC transporter permease [Bacillus sp. L_1B0_8]KIQ87353.1 ABC transporter permease [Bacillus sp. L_1B0_5]MBZ8122143.1 ABC transporter permease [Bacillus thuringiensis]MCU7675232.1 ABC transporter permease [Bacillus thuringiensis]
MSLCRLARKNIRTFATKRMKQFIWIAMSTMILFFMISLQFNEGAILKVGDTFVFQMYFYTLFIVLIFICIFTTYKMMYSLLLVRREEFTSYVAENMKRKEVLCLLCQEQLFIYGAAFVFGLINGMLFLKLFTVIFMKIAGIQGVNSAPITIYAVVIISVIMMTVVLISMMQCYRFVRSLKDENSLRFKERA